MILIKNGKIKTMANAEYQNNVDEIHSNNELYQQVLKEYIEVLESKLEDLKG